MKRTYHNHDIEDYINYHNRRYILHITTHHTTNIYELLLLLVSDSIVPLCLSLVSI